MLPCGVPKEWIQLHYKSLKRLKAAKAQAEQRAARLIAERATLPRDDPVRNPPTRLCAFASAACGLGWLISCAVGCTLVRHCLGTTCWIVR